MIQIYRIPVPKECLRAMPKDERVLFLLLGYAANQLSMLQKLLIFVTNRTPDAEVEQHATGTQTQMLVRLMVGAAEAWELVKPASSKNLWRRNISADWILPANRPLTRSNVNSADQTCSTLLGTTMPSTIQRVTKPNQPSRRRSTIVNSTVIGICISRSTASIRCSSYRTSSSCMALARKRVDPSWRKRSAS